MAKPTLRDIADMAYPASRDAVRRFYDRDWGRFLPDEPAREIVVAIDYEVTREETFTVTVTASSVIEAENIARDLLHEQEGTDIVENWVRMRDPLARSVDQPSLFKGLVH